MEKVNSSSLMGVIQGGFIDLCIKAKPPRRDSKAYSTSLIQVFGVVWRLGQSVRMAKCDGPCGTLLSRQGDLQNCLRATEVASSYCAPMRDDCVHGFTLVLLAQEPTHGDDALTAHLRWGYCSMILLFSSSVRYGKVRTRLMNGGYQPLLPRRP